MSSETFHIDDLVLCYAPPNLRSVMPGNRVMLRSGGHEMVVDYVDKDGLAVCSWSVNNERHTYSFDLRMLTCYGAK